MVPGLVPVWALLVSAVPSEHLDVGRWLDKEGSRLVAVDFFAHWCLPCIGSIPAWRSIKQRLSPHGLRTIVVVSQDPGGCVAPKIDADEYVCDEDGSIARAFGVNDLPAAFLWSWQGALLVDRGFAEDVGQAADAWIKTAPRVAVEAKSADLASLVRAAIARTGKMAVLAGTEEQRTLDRMKARSYAPRYDDDLRCELGKQLSANASLRVRITESGRLMLMLFDAQSACLVASGIAPFEKSRAEEAVEEAVHDLLQHMRRRMTVPQGERWMDAGAGREDGTHVIHFVSEPPGAEVVVDGKPTCRSAGEDCVREVEGGVHRVVMRMTGFKDRVESVRIEASTIIGWKLEPAEVARDRMAEALAAVDEKAPGFAASWKKHRRAQAIAAAPASSAGALYALAMAVETFDKAARPDAVALMKRVRTLDPKHDGAGADRYLALRALAAGEVDEAQAYYEHALRMTPDRLETKLEMAEKLAVRTRDRAYFERLIREVVASPASEALKGRARALLADADRLFSK